MKELAADPAGARTGPSAMPGALLAVALLAALVVSVAAFSLHQVGVGVGAASIALLAAGATLSWLSAQARRVRDAQRIAH